MVVSFSVMPIGEQTELEHQLAEVIKVIDASGLPYQVHAMATEVEGEWDEVMEVIKAAHEIGRKFSGRVLTNIAIDDHEGFAHGMLHKVEEVQEILGKKLERV